MTTSTAICDPLPRVATLRPQRPRIVVAESRGFSPRALELLAAWGEVELHNADRDSLLEVASKADVLWVRLRHQIDREVLAAAPQLRCVVSPTTGLNHIDLEQADRWEVKVLSLRGEVDFLRNIRATAELSVGLMLALLRNLPPAMAHVQGGGWNRDLFQGHELYGKTVGIVGYGRLGRIVARYLNAFDAEVLAADPAISSSELEPGVELVALPELLARSQIVSLHVNLTAANQSMFGAAQFTQMQPGSWLVNTVRGQLLDEAALLHVLDSGHLAGAALDVLANESASGVGGHPLVQYAQTHSNLILTPHLGGCTFESMAKTEEFMAERLETWWRSVAQGGGA